MISIENVTFSYPGSPPIFQDFSWRVERGQAWAVLGPSGCGKTTLLYLMAGLQVPASGTVFVAGQSLACPRPQTGLILQEYGLLPWATVRENITLGLQIRSFYGPDGRHAPVPKIGISKTGLPKTGMRSAMRSAIQAAGGDVDDWLARLGLADYAAKYPVQLSGGQRQRTAIARTLVLQPDLLLMDEPFSALDAPTRLGLEDLTLQLWKEQRFTFIIVTHTIEEAAYLGQKILVLGHPPHRQGKVFTNPVFGQPETRDSEAYRQLCRMLRAELGNV